MYDTEFWLWSIVPFVNTSVFIGVLVGLLLGRVLSLRGRIALAFTGTSFVATVVVFVTTWLRIAKEEAGYYVLIPVGPFTAYTIVTAWVAGIGLVGLGLWKAYDLLRSPKPEEKGKD